MVAEGRFSSISAVIQHSLDRLREEIERREAETTALRALLEERRQGEFVPFEEFHRQTEEMIAEKRADYGL